MTSTSTLTAPTTTAWHEPVGAYCQHLRRDAGRSAGTVRLRRHHLVRLARHLGAAGSPAAVDPWAVSTPELLEWMGARAWSPETRKSARASLRGFYGWAQDAGRVHRSPAAALPPVCVPRAVPRPIPDPLAAAALRVADHRGQLLLALAAYCGLRCAELAQVHSGDLIADGLLVHGKGGHERLVPLLDEGLRAAVAGADGFLFPGRVEGHLSAQYVSRLLSSMLPRPWTGHTLRHRAASAAYAATSDLRAVQELLGHASVRTTERYVAVSGHALRAAAAAANGLRA